MGTLKSLEEVIEIALDSHWDQKDKVGEPYILHLFRVMLKMKTPEEREVALLHDILEDTPTLEADLADEHISAEVIEAVSCMTRRAGEPYSQLITRCKQNDLARRVKIADLEDHLEQDDITRVLSAEKRSDYVVALEVLQ